MSTRLDPIGCTQVVTLIYELLDAHADTASLAAGLSDDLSWAAHLEYLRALQRGGREMLADISAGRALADAP
jgi:hypothetical protein